MEKATLTTQNELVPTEQKPRCTKIQAEEMVEKTGQYRSLGFTFQKIGDTLGISKTQACKYFKRWAALHKKEWDENKDTMFVRMNEAYSRRLAESERNYLNSKGQADNQTMGAWSKHIIEILKEYQGFLKDWGLLRPEDATDLSTQKTIEPIDIIIERTKKQLLERITIAAENKNLPG